MGRKNSLMKSAAAFAALSMTFGSTANAATTTLQSIDPLVTVSLFGTAGSRSAVCAAGAQAAATGGAVLAAQATGPATGCVLPVVDAPPPPPAAEAVPPPPPPPLEPVAAGIGVLPLLLGLAAIAGAAALILGDDDEDEINIPVPISP